MGTQTHAQTSTRTRTHTGTEASQPQVQPLSSLDQKKVRQARAEGGSHIVLSATPLNPKSHLSSQSDNKYKEPGKDHVIQGLRIQ